MQITKVPRPADEAFVDVMEGCERWEIQIGQHGLVALMDVMPRLVPAGRTADFAIVQAARTSTGKGLKSPAEDRQLLRYLYQHQHTSPFEMVNLKFKHQLPIFVARQLVRHRTASLNELSLRYSQAQDRFWIPAREQLRTQSKTNKQVSEGPLDLAAADAFIRDLEVVNQDALAKYQAALASGVGREQARTLLPLSLFTEWVWELDLKNLLHFLGLRQDAHAQAEIRVYADAMYELLKPIVPLSLEAYDDYHPNRGGVLLSRMEAKVLSLFLTGDAIVTASSLRCAATDHGLGSKREIEEMFAKFRRLGITIED